MIPEAKELISCCRMREGVTLRKLASMTGFASDQIARWEKGVNEPRFEFVLWVLDALGYELVLKRKDEGRQ